MSTPSKEEPVFAVPQSELAVIGAMLCDGVRGASIAAEYGLKSKWFSDPMNKAIWEVMMAMPADQIDGMTVVEACSKTSVNTTLKYLEHCIDASGNAISSMRYHVESMKDVHVRRYLVAMASTIRGMAADPSASSVKALSEIIAQTVKAQAVFCDNKQRTAKQVYSDLIQYIDDRIHHRGKDGIPSCIPGFNELLGGYQGICIIAARPGAGKSTFLGNELAHSAGLGRRVALASHEMTEEQFRLRILCERANVSSFAVQLGKVSGGQFQDLVKQASTQTEWPFRINDSSMTIDQLCGWMAAEVQVHGAEVLGVDYLQILVSASHRKDTRAQEVAGWMNLIRETQKRLGVPVLIVSQMSREYEKEGRKPRLSDLRESGAIEQDASQVIFLHSTPKETMGIVAKNRFGPCGTVPLVFDKTLSRFGEGVASEEPEEPQRKGWGYAEG